MEKYYTPYATANSLGRWLQVDHLADKFAGVSPYNYCLNNPLRFIDLFGFEPKNPWVYNSETGLYQVSDEPVIVGEKPSDEMDKEEKDSSKEYDDTKTK